jgi:ADP-heptose:LPS heptosyltransferase
MRANMAAPGKNQSFSTMLARHAAALGYVLRMVLPVILRTGRRPVIFSRGSGMGDILCTFPAVQQLRQRHPGTFCIYNCHASFAEVPRLAGVAVADQVTSLETIGLVGYWYRWLLGGFYHFAHGDDLPVAGCQEPMVAEFCRQFGVIITEEHPKIQAGPAAQARVRTRLAEKNLAGDDLVLIHPGPSWTVREWPLENWTRLVASLRAQGCQRIAQLGVSRHLNFGKVEVPLVPGSVSLLDEFSVEECFAVIAAARLFIGIDSGLLHIAACTRTPAIGIFGMTLPEYRFSSDYRKDFVVNRIACAGCEHRKPRLHWVTGCPHDIECMETLPVEPVLRACLEKLKLQK